MKPLLQCLHPIGWVSAKMEQTNGFGRVCYQVQYKDWYMNLGSDLNQNPDGFISNLLALFGSVESLNSIQQPKRKWLWHVFIGSYPLTLAIPQAVAGTYRFLPAEDWAFRHLDYMPQPWLLGTLSSRSRFSFGNCKLECYWIGWYPAAGDQCSVLCLPCPFGRMR